MRVEIRVGADDGLAALDLYRWLRKDPELRRHAAVNPGRPRPGDGTMGATDVIELVVGQSIAALNLALAYAAWRAARPTAPCVTITVDGRSVTLQGACDDETIRRITDLLSRPADGPRRPENDLETA
ncbi:hypothetical protein AB0I77_51260 [Streptomyces sp. NPDC050619]|uniref:effector-associated constant component EACC1 n=1 Tax=Streptomyces sp. NPDC050619 TaxID=3157214 RepID=UPI003442CF13